MNQIDTNQAVINSEQPTDRVTKTKTMYEVSAFELMWRNFIAGFMRAFGGILMYLIFIYIIATLFSQLLLPHLKPFLESYQNALSTFTQFSNTSPLPESGEQNINQQQLQQILQQLGQ